MAVCAEYRIPHSEFLGWSADDRAKAMWWQLRQRQTCSGCGTRQEEWIGPDGKPRLDAFKVVAQLCHGCRAISHERERQGDKPPAGLRFVLKKKPREVTVGGQQA